MRYVRILGRSKTYETGKYFNFFLISPYLTVISPNNEKIEKKRNIF